MTPSPQPSPAAFAEYFLVCITGPDQGKRLALTTAPLRVGHNPECNLMSDDPDVTDHFATLHFDGSQLRVQAMSHLLPFVDGHPVADGTIAVGQQLRLGRSVWQLQGPGMAPSMSGFVNRLGNYLSHVAAVEKPGEWNPREILAAAGKKHPDEETEAYFTVGSAGTTPPFAAIDAAWPRPWVFARVLGLTLLLYVGFLAVWESFHTKSNVFPALIMIGSVAVPLSLLIFFFEINVPRNISLYQVIKLLLIGGLASIVASLLFPLHGSGMETLFPGSAIGNWLGAAGAGIIEEAGKGLTLLLVVRKPRFRWTLNGLLIGAAVGTGFAIFESAGYFLSGLAAAPGATETDLSAIVTVLTALNGPPAHKIVQHGVLSALGGHVLWTGLVGAALWRVRGDRPFDWAMVRDRRFLSVLGICMAMHVIWNSPLALPLYGKFVILGGAAWFLVLGMVRSGLQEVREAQVAGGSTASAA